MIDIATPLYAAFQRAADSVVDAVAKEGLTALKRTLDKAKFAKSEYLKDYEVFAHVLGTEIEFEIVLNVESVEPADEMTRRAMEEEEVTEEEVLERELARTYGWHMRGPRRLRDVRKPARDARQPARDARQRVGDTRKTSKHRLMEHEMALRSPRSATVTPEGKLSVSMRRSMRETEEEVRMPQGKFQGVINEFMKELREVVTDSFAIKLQEIVSKYVR